MKKFGFTLAEVLITLAIIGIVAALTIPVLMASYQKTQYVTQLKKFYTTFQNGTKIYMQNDGCNTLSCTGVFDGAVNMGGNWETQVRNYVDKSFKVLKYYSSGSDELNAEVTSNLASSMIELTRVTRFSGMYSFSTVDGMLVGIDDPDWGNCNGSELPSAICATVDVDTNGIKGPNVWGRDTFEFALTNDGSLTPLYSQQYAKAQAAGNESMPWLYDMLMNSNYWAKSPGMCGEPGKITINPTTDEINGNACAARIIEEGWEMNY